MKRVFLLGVTLIISAVNALSQDPNQKIPVDDKVKIGKLENGLTYYIRKNEKPANKVELRLAIKAGSILENEEQLGLAHFMEHMNFNGTKNFPKNELVDYLQSIGVEFGADLNAYTSFDETVYMLPIPLDKKEYLDKGMLVIEDWAFNALLTDEEIDKERGVILEELRTGKGASERMLQRWLPQVYKNSRYAERLPIGKEELLKTFTYDKIRSYHKNWYRPNLMAVIVVGDIDVNDIENRIKKQFGKYKNPKNAPERTYYSRPKSNEPILALESDPEASSTNIIINYFDKESSKASVNIKDYKKELVYNLFTDMIINRLDEIRNKPNPPYTYAYSFYSESYAKNLNAYSSFAVTSAENVTRTLKTVLEENRRLQLHGFTTSELERAKTETIAYMEKAYANRNTQESGRIVSQYINNFLDGEPIPSIEWEYNMIQKIFPTISVREVSSLIDKFIHDDNMTVLITGKEKYLSKDEVLNIINEVKSSNPKAYEDASAGLSLMKNYTPNKGGIKGSMENKNIGSTTLFLSNGVKVTYKKTDFKDDEILMTAYRDGGNSNFTDSEYLKTYLAIGAMTESGVNGINKNDLKKVMTGKIANVTPYISEHSEGFRGSSSKKDVETMFQLIHLYAVKTNKSEEAFRTYQSRMQAYYSQVINNPQAYFFNEFSKYANQNDPRNVGNIPVKENWDRIDYNLAYNKYQKTFSNMNDMHFYFVGAIDEEKIKELSKQYLSSLPSAGSTQSYTDRKVKSLEGKNEKVIEAGQDDKSTLIINMEKDVEYDIDEKMKIIMLGKVLEIRLTELLREEKGGVYSLYVGGDMEKIPTGKANLTMYIPTSPERVDEMKEAALANLQEIQKKGVSDENLNKVKKEMLVNYKEGIEQNKTWLRFLKSHDQLGTDANDFLNYEKRVNSITTSDLKKAGNEYFSKDCNMIIGKQIPKK